MGQFLYFAVYGGFWFAINEVLTNFTKGINCLNKKAMEGAN